MNRKLLNLLIGLVTLLGLTLVPTGNASALGGEWLGCRISPGNEFNFNQTCINQPGATQYGVAFMVQNETQSSTYSWAIPSGYATKIYSGCASTNNWCTLLVGRSYQEITMGVTITQSGGSATLYSTASIEPSCGTQYC